ncbi:MAG: hypothetical protein GF409_00080, partial [Candidatus Omnitrophica bacterium]|nr:hypothetical protein [Candidatus Omnitrophota bacterium]
MNLRKSKLIKIIAIILIFTLLSEEIARADGFSLFAPKDKLQPQYFSGPINNILQHENYIKFTLQYILENSVSEIAENQRRIFDHKLVPGKGFVFDFREDRKNSENGKRKEGSNWVIPCAIGDIDEIREEHVYRWPYEAIVNEDKEVLRIRKRGEKRELYAPKNDQKPGKSQIETEKGSFTRPVEEEHDQSAQLDGEKTRAPPEIDPAPKTSGIESPHEPPLSETLKKLLKTAASIHGWEKPSYRMGQIEAINKLKDGTSVELRTGGGKTLTLGGAALMRYIHTGERTLILTHEDALTEQAMSKDRMGEVLSHMGVATGFILPDETGEVKGVLYRDGRSERTSAEEVYREAAIIYAKWDRIIHRYMGEKNDSQKEVLSKNKYFTLFDEADLMLVFGAATPAIISSGGLDNGKTRLEIRKRIDGFVAREILTDKNTYYAPLGTKEVYLSLSGQKKTRKVLEDIAAISDTHADIVKLSGETFVLDALRAHLFYHEGEQYFVKRDVSGEVIGVLVRDEQTGAPKGTVTRDERTGQLIRKGMSFGEGLQQAVEIMAGVPVGNLTPETKTGMSMTIVHFLRSGEIITDFAGASGTMETERFQSIYPGKKVESVEGATERLISTGHHGFSSKSKKRRELLKRLRQKIGDHQPILLKAASDAETEQLKTFLESSLKEELSSGGIIVNTADGSSPADFSSKIAQAGHANVITIVTNLAHRGIDIEIKGTTLNPDGTEGEEVPLVNGKIPGLHVISLYLDEAEAFEIQTKGRADRGKDEVQGSWEGLFSLDENLFTRHKELLSHHLVGLRRAIARDEKERIEKLIAEVRELIVSEKNKTDEKKRKYEDEVFEYQMRILRLLGITRGEKNFTSFLRGIGAYEAIAADCSSDEELSEKLLALRGAIQTKIHEALELFQTEQQRTRSRINYLASLSQLGVRGAFTQLNEELITATRLVRNYRLKVKDTREFLRDLLTASMGEGISRVKPRTPGTSNRGAAFVEVVSIMAVVSAAALISLWGIQPLLSSITDPVRLSLVSYPFVSTVTATTLLIPAVYLRQAFARKISQLDNSTVDFLRFTAGIGRGSGIKAFLKWIGKMVLQILAGPGLYAGAGTLIAAVSHPVILAGYAPIAVPAALTGIGLALIANLALIYIHNGQFSKVKHVQPGRFQHGFDVFVRSIAISTGLLIAMQIGAGSFVPTALAAGIVLASSIVSGIASWKAGAGFYKDRLSWRIGALGGVLSTGGLVALASLIGSGSVFGSALSLLRITVGILGVGIVLLQTLQARKLAEEASREGQNPVRAAVESFLPSTRNIMMYATAIPAAVLNFTGIAPASIFLVGVTCGVFLVYRYSVNMEKLVGRSLSKGITKAMGGSILMSAGVTPVVVFPERAYEAQEERLELRDWLLESGTLSEVQAKALRQMRTYSKEQFAGLRILGRNIESVLDSVMDDGDHLQDAEKENTQVPPDGEGKDVSIDKAPEKLLPEQQRLLADSPLAITLIASHMETKAPVGLPRQTNEKKRTKQDPVDFIHVRNISESTVNLADYS